MQSPGASKIIAWWLALPLAFAWGIACSTSATATRDPAVLGIRHGASGESDRVAFDDLRAEAELGREDPDAELSVDLADDARLFGMRRFRVRDPARALAEAPVLEELARAGVLAPRQVPLYVSVDDAPAIQRVLEEDFSKELFESQQRREGVLFRFDPDRYPEVRVEPYGAKKIRKKRPLTMQLETAEALLAGFVRGTLPAPDVFDLDAMATFLAIAEVYEADSMLAFANLRFYFNPVTQRIEPIGHRALPTQSENETLATRRAPWSSRLLEDPELSVRFHEKLRSIAAEIAARDGVEPGLARRARSIAALAPPEHPGAEPRLVVADGARALDVNPIPSASLEQALTRHPFLAWDEQRRTLSASAGSWNVEGSLVLPEGAGLDLRAGTTLRFEPDAMLLASGPLRFVGTVGSPVVLEAAPGGAGVAASWQGIAVLHSDRPHLLEHVSIRETSGVGRAGWALTGGVTFRASEVQISESRIDGSSAEDALNLIRSRFSFSGLSITGTASDAFDCDFCRGSIHGGRIERVAGDGIDLSGSVVTVDGTRLAGIGDKALSVGEESRMTARELVIDDVGTAAASKDGSELVIADSEISRVHWVALMAYVKKPEYGPARLEASRIRLDGVARAALVQHGSRLSIDGVEHETEALDVDSLYRDGPMKK